VSPFASPYSFALLIRHLPLVTLRPPILQLTRSILLIARESEDCLETLLLPHCQVAGSMAGIVALHPNRVHSALALALSALTLALYPLLLLPFPHLLLHPLPLYAPSTPILSKTSNTIFECYTMLVECCRLLSTCCVKKIRAASSRIGEPSRGCSSVSFRSTLQIA
jgi:hypothetical protein